MQGHLCSLCSSNDTRGMVLRLDTRAHVCRRCISEGQRAEIFSLKTYYESRRSSIDTDLQAAKQREHALQADLQAAKQREHALQADLQAARKREEALQADLKAANSSIRQRLKAMQRELESQAAEAKQAREDHEFILSLYSAAQADLQSLKADEESSESLSAKHQHHRANEAKQAKLTLAEQTLQRVEVELKSAQAITSQQHLIRMKLEQQLSAKDSSLSLLRSCNLEIVKRLKQSQKDVLDLELELVRQSGLSLPDGSVTMYIKELMPGTENTVKDVAVTNIEIDSKTGALLTQYFEQEQIMLIRSNGFQLEPAGILRQLPFKTISYSDFLAVCSQ